MTLSAHVSIAHPAWMDITGPDGAVTHGADQDWFPDLWQQRAGCGPTAAAVILSYLARTRPELAPLYPEGAMDRASFTGLMCRVWEHVTPVSTVSTGRSRWRRAWPPLPPPGASP